MRRGRRLPELELSGEQRSTLPGWTRRRKTAQALSMRARIVLRASEGVTATAIAAETRCVFRRSVNGGTGLWSRVWTGCSMSRVPDSPAN